MSTWDLNTVSRLQRQRQMPEANRRGRIRDLISLIRDEGIFRDFRRAFSRSTRSRRRISNMAATGNNSERGMTLLAVMAIMAVFAVALLAVAPSIQQEVERQKEIEAISRGEEVAE